MEVLEGGKPCHIVLSEEAGIRVEKAFGGLSSGRVDFVTEGHQAQASLYYKNVWQSREIFRFTCDFFYNPAQPGPIRDCGGIYNKITRQLTIGVMAFV